MNTQTRTTTAPAASLRQAAGVPPAPAKEDKRTAMQLLSDPKVRQQIAMVVPKHITADKLARVVMTEMRRVPKLAQCTQVTLLGSVMQAAQLGLEVGGPLGHCYLIPYWNKRKGVLECQFQIGYRGMLDLARRSGQVQSIEARAVYEGDHFRLAYGIDSVLEHVPSMQRTGGLLRVYAIARLQGGGVQFEVMSKAEVDAIRIGSQSGDDGPWVTHYEQMALKTVIRRMFKFLPVSVELQRGVAIDEQVEVGVGQDFREVLDGTGLVSDSDEETGEVPAPPPPAAEAPATPQPSPAPTAPPKGGAS